MNEIALRKLPGGTARLRALEGTLVINKNLCFHSCPLHFARNSAFDWLGK